jgi:small ligand-binding sensory domain FIST
MNQQFPWAHATHPDWRMAASLCLAQVESASRSGPGAQATLGFLYLTDHYAEPASEILAFLRERTGITHWTGAIGVGIAAGSAEYIDEPAMAFMLADFSPDDFQVFSGKSRPPARGARTPDGRHAAWTALVHADAATPDLAELIQDMSGKIAGDTLFGGLSSSRHANTLIADEIFAGGLSGVVLSENISVASRISQGCQPIGPVHKVTASTGRLLNRLDGEPALDVLLHDMGAPAEWSHSAQHTALPPAARKKQTASAVQMLQGTFIGVGEGDAFMRGNYLVRPLVGVDPHERALALGAELESADHVVFCRRDSQAARIDLIRACTELREGIENDYGSMSQIRGVLYISCLGRTGTLFGGPSAEMQLVQQQLGDVPLIGLFANGEIHEDRMYAYTGVLIAFL